MVVVLVHGIGCMGFTAAHDRSVAIAFKAPASDAGARISEGD